MASFSDELDRIAPLPAQMLGPVSIERQPGAAGR
jgi:hypothetical protein